MTGLLNENISGAPVKLNAVMLDTAAEIAIRSPLTLAMIRHHVQEQHSDGPDFSLFRLSAALKKRGFNFKRTRFRQKNGMRYLFNNKEIYWK